MRSRTDRFETSGTPFDEALGAITFVPDKGTMKKMLISIDSTLNVSFLRVDKPQP